MARGTAVGRIDPRTWLFHLLAAVIAIVSIHSDKGGLCLFAWCMAVHLVTRNGRFVLLYLASYVAFTCLAWIGVRLLPDDGAYFVGLALSNMGILGRKALVPLSFAACLAQEPTGSLMAALQRIRLPKAVGIGIAVLLRFFPTMGGEYRAIRASQRFRGIGVGVMHTLAHLPSTVESTLIPLLLRATRIAEELSASITVRGVRFSGRTISFHPVGLTWKDAVLCIVATAVPAAIVLLEGGGVL